MRLWSVTVRFAHSFRQTVHGLCWSSETTTQKFTAIEADSGIDAQAHALNLLRLQYSEIGFAEILDCHPSGYALPDNIVEEP